MACFPALTVEHIDEVLPQTQCGLCGYPGCKPYAAAIMQGENIHLCPPGGIEGLHKLAALTKTPISAEMQAALQARLSTPVLAHIRPEECIGCTKCIQACPVDAIIGAAKYLHTVLINECTGCGLCVAPCPVDCIDLLATPQLSYQKTRAKAHYQAKLARNDFKRTGIMPTAQNETITDKKRFIAEAVARAKHKRTLANT